VRTRELLRAVLQAGALAHLVWRLTETWVVVSSVHGQPWRTSAWVALGPIVATLFSISVLVLAPWISRRIADSVLTEASLRRTVEVVTGTWCLGVASTRAANLLLWPELEGLDALFANLAWNMPSRVGVGFLLHAGLAAVLLVGFDGIGRFLRVVGRWMRETFGPIPTRD
jgi:hypothetical protein